MVVMVSAVVAFGSAFRLQVVSDDVSSATASRSSVVHPLALRQRKLAPTAAPLVAADAQRASGVSSALSGTAAEQWEQLSPQPDWHKQTQSLRWYNDTCRSTIATSTQYSDLEDSGRRRPRFDNQNHTAPTTTGPRSTASTLPTVHAPAVPTPGMPTVPRRPASVCKVGMPTCRREVRLRSANARALRMCTVRMRGV